MLGVKFTDKLATLTGHVNQVDKHFSHLAGEETQVLKKIQGAIKSQATKYLELEEQLKNIETL